MEMKDVKALGEVLKAVADLELPDQERVLRWAAEKLGTKFVAAKLPGIKPQVGISEQGDGDDLEKFDTLADAIGSAHAKTDSLRVLVAAAYISKKKNQPEVTGLEINGELKNIGHRVGNITDAINALKAKKPQWMVQTRKDGKSKQARKKYKVTSVGFEQVASMLGGSVAEDA